MYSIIEGCWPNHQTVGIHLFHLFVIQSNRIVLIVLASASRCRAIDRIFVQCVIGLGISRIWSDTISLFFCCWRPCWFLLVSFVGWFDGSQIGTKKRWLVNICCNHFLLVDIQYVERDRERISRPHEWPCFLPLVVGVLFCLLRPMLKLGVAKDDFEYPLLV